jgi:hypothetical protein
MVDGRWVEGGGGWRRRMREVGGVSEMEVWSLGVPGPAFLFSVEKRRKLPPSSIDAAALIFFSLQNFLFVSHIPTHAVKHPPASDTHKGRDGSACAPSPLDLEGRPSWPNLPSHRF